MGLATRLIKTPPANPLIKFSGRGIIKKIEKAKLTPTKDLRSPSLIVLGLGR